MNVVYVYYAYVYAYAYVCIPLGSSFCHLGFGQAFLCLCNLNSYNTIARFTTSYDSYPLCM